MLNSHEVAQTDLFSTQLVIIFVMHGYFAGPVRGMKNVTHSHIFSQKNIKDALLSRFRTNYVALRFNTVKTL